MEASAAAPVDREVVEQVADEVVRRLHDVSARQVDLEAVAQQIDTITIASMRWRRRAVEPTRRTCRSGASRKVARGRRASGSLAAESSAAINAALGAHLAELRSEQAGAEQRTQSRLADLQSILEILAARLASIESELAADDVDEELLPPARSASPAPPLGSASPGDAEPEAAPQRTAKPSRRAPEIRRLSPPTTARTSSSSPARARRSARAKPVTSHRLSGLRPIPRSASTLPLRGAPRRRQWRKTTPHSTAAASCRLCGFRKGAVRRARSPISRGFLRQSQSAPCSSASRRDRDDARRANGRRTSAISATLGKGGQAVNTASSTRRRASHRTRRRDQTRR